MESNGYQVISRRVTPGFKRKSVDREIARRRSNGELVSIEQFIKLLHLPFKLEDWQLADLKACIEAVKQGEICLVRSRNGSKTFDMILLALYFAYLGLCVMFYVAEGTQMEQPVKYANDLVKRTFLKYVLEDNKHIRTKTFVGSGEVKIRLLSEKKARSPRADVVIFDEEGLMEEIAYLSTFGITKSSKIGLRIHSSTPVRGSIFHKNVKRLEKAGLVVKRPWQQIGFLDKKQFEIDRKIMPDFVFKREYECSFENPGGAIFTNVVYGKCEEELTDWKCGGLDFNPVQHHYLVSGKWTKDMLGFCVTDVVDISEGFSDSIDNRMFDRILPFIIRKNKLTAEDGGANLGFSAWLRDQIRNSSRYQTYNVKYQEWNIKSKFENVVKAMRIKLYIDPAYFPNLAMEVEQATWDDKSPDPKIAKNPAKSPHRLDALLHALSDRNWKPLIFKSFSS